MVKDYYTEIKNILINNEINKKVKDYSKNKGELESYYEVGKLLIEAQGGEKRAKYGNQLIKVFSKKLKEEVGKKYSVTTLKYMRQFYVYSIGQPLTDQLTWSHYIEILPIKDNNKREYYINVVQNEKIGSKKLRKRIKSEEYERLPKVTKAKLINNEKLEMVEIMHNPIIIPNPGNIDNIKEKILKKTNIRRFR